MKIGSKEQAIQALRELQERRRKSPPQPKPAIQLPAPITPAATSPASQPMTVRDYLFAMRSAGGRARAKKLTPERRQAIARLGAQARWPKR